MANCVLAGLLFSLIETLRVDAVGVPTVGALGALARVQKSCSVVERVVPFPLVAKALK